MRIGLDRVVITPVESNLSMGEAHHPWGGRFRLAFLISAIISISWTVVLVLPFDPFNNLIAIMIGGDAGTWLLFGYLLYLCVGLGGFAGLSYVVSSIEDEGRSPNPFAMWFSIAALIAGVNTTCLLLGYAGASGGYAQTIQHLPGTNLDQLLSPYVDVTRVSAFIAALGGLSAVVGLAFVKEGKTA
jgi:hypothetical protein